MLPSYLHSATSAGAGGGDDEDPHRHPFRLISAHETVAPGDQEPYQEEQEADQSTQLAKKTEGHYRTEHGPFELCPICQRMVKSSKALDGNMRSHTDQDCRGIVPPEKWDPPVGVATMADASAAEGSGGEGIEWPVRCQGCGANLQTKRALRGFRADRKSKKGCPVIARGGLRRYFHGASTSNNHNNNGNGNDINNNSNAGMGNNGGGVNRRDGSGQVAWVVDLNLPPPQEEEEEDEQGKE